MLLRVDKQILKWQLWSQFFSCCSFLWRRIPLDSSVAVFFLSLAVKFQGPGNVNTQWADNSIRYFNRKLSNISVMLYFINKCRRTDTKYSVIYYCTWVEFMRSARRCFLYSLCNVVVKRSDSGRKLQLLLFSKRKKTTSCETLLKWIILSLTT